MQNGNWVPISKYFAYALPRDRQFNDLEAMYSLQLDYDNNNTITILGCSARWGWSRTKVINFLLDHEIVISYPDELKSLRKKRGFIDIVPEKKRHKKKHKEDNKEAIKEHKRFIDSKWIADKKNNKETIKKHKKSNRKVTTIDPNIIFNPKEETTKLLFEKAFEKWWPTYPKRNGRRIGKKEAKKKFLKFKQSDWTNLKTATKNYSASLTKSGLSPSDAHRFLNETWKEYIEKADNSTNNDGREKAQQQIEETKKYL